MSSTSDLLGGPGRAFADLHCHTAWSPDSLSSPGRVARVAAERGLTHLAVTDHGRLEGALEARAGAPEGLTIIVGQEIATTEGDLIGLYLERAVPGGLSAAEAAAAVREQGGLVGLAHPFDRFRGSVLAARAAGDGALDAMADLVDYVETYNARVPLGQANDRAAEWASRHGLPGAAVSDAHTLFEVGVSYLILDRSINGPDDLRRALPGARPVTSRASYAVRLATPLARLVHRVRGERPAAGA